MHNKGGGTFLETNEAINSTRARWYVSNFFQVLLELIGKDVIDASLKILNSESMPNSLNHTFISLIPKIKSPEKAKDF